MRMKLETYLKDKQTDAAFAAEIGCSQSQINRLRRGEAFPSPEMVEKIHTATAGQVTASDWYDLPAPKSKRGQRSSGVAA